MKYAVVEISGKQYLVAKGKVIDVDKLETGKNKKAMFDKVMLFKDKDQLLVGKPYLKNIKIEAEVLHNFKDKNIRVAKFRAKSRYRLVKGHRQLKTKLKIAKILS